MDGVTALATQARAELTPVPPGGVPRRGRQAPGFASGDVLRYRALVGGYTLIGSSRDIGRLDRVAARCLRHHPGAAQESAHRMKAAGASADGVQGLEFYPARPAPQSAGGDILHVRHELCRKIDLEADAPVHLLAAGERHADRLVRNQRQAAAGALANDAQFVEQLVAQVVGLVHHDQRLAVVQAVDDGSLCFQRRTMVPAGTDRLAHQGQKTGQGEHGA